MNYLQLASIPLFTGISGEDLALILDRVELLEVELEACEEYVDCGTVCQCMAILLEGTMTQTRTNHAGTFMNMRRQEVPLRYDITELLSGPHILEPEILFGLENRHAGTWTAKTPCRLILISKKDIRQTLMYVPVWRINFINMLSTHTQRCLQQKMPRVSPNLERRILDFILLNTTHGARRVRIGITLEQLAYFLGTCRNTLTKTLRQMERQGLLDKELQGIVVPDIARISREAHP